MFSKVLNAGIACCFRLYRRFMCRKTFNFSQIYLYFLLEKQFHYVQGHLCPLESVFHLSPKIRDMPLLSSFFHHFISLINPAFTRCFLKIARANIVPKMAVTIVVTKANIRYGPLINSTKRDMNSPLILFPSASFR